MLFAHYVCIQKRRRRAEDNFARRHLESASARTICAEGSLRSRLARRHGESASTRLARRHGESASTRTRLKNRNFLPARAERVVRSRSSCSKVATFQLESNVWKVRSRISSSKTAATKQSSAAKPDSLLEQPNCAQIHSREVGKRKNEHEREKLQSIMRKRSCQE